MHPAGGGRDSPARAVRVAARVRAAVSVQDEASVPEPAEVSGLAGPVGGREVPAEDSDREAPAVVAAPSVEPIPASAGPIILN
jgi:hypothetical protein